MIINTYPSAQAAEAACAEAMIADLATALNAQDGTVAFLVSGGKTPVRILPQVFATDLDWSRIVMFASDERLVSQSHADSTEGMVMALAKDAGVEVRYLGYGDDLTPDRALAFWRAQIETCGAIWVSGLIGIGDDAHFASLFPNRSEIEDATLFAAHVEESLPHKHDRLTLGLKALGQFAHLHMVVSGLGKNAALDMAMTSGADVRACPAVALNAFNQLVIHRAP